jgi:transcriptional regulator of acetoin/glycerol metabolism
MLSISPREFAGSFRVYASLVLTARTSFCCVILTASPFSEKDWILNALEVNRYHRSRTARALGVFRKTLYNKMSRYDLL